MMIKQISLLANQKRIAILPKEESLFKIGLSIPVEFQNCAFDLEITFQFSVEKIRNSDHQWIDSKNDFIATSLVPKILKLTNGFFVQPNLTIGIWEYNKKFKDKITWRFNHPEASLLTIYKSDSCNKNYRSIDPRIIDMSLCLLFSQGGAVEFSRSKIPFSAVACFTDHCDFDTLENLKLQRHLLKNTGVKITKGFFLNHFSKRSDNASWRNDSDELKKWLEDGHELAYHSLSQSIKSNEESVTDFENFKQVENVVSWIDHGFQPYNFSLIENTEICSQTVYFNKLTTENVSILWNYIDSGTSTAGVLNQLNPNHFTLQKFWKGSHNSSIFNKFQQFIKNILFHHYADEILIENYKAISQNIKKIVFDYNIKEIPAFLKNSIKVFVPLLKIILFWNSNKKRPYRFAKYNSIVFPFVKNGKVFTIFQTLEMLDFIKSLSPKNIDLLIQEKGVFIAHTYFSVPMKYHLGRMFTTEDTINTKVKHNFMYLGQKIANNEIWNPTLKELVDFLTNFENVVLDADTKGNISVINNSNLPFRTVN